MMSRSVNRNRLAVAILGAVVAGLLSAFAIVAPAAAAGLGPPDSWVPTGQMHVARVGQTATLLPDGTVLVAGGGTAQAELYDPATRTFSRTAPLPVSVTDATATLLPNGRVLVAGGLHGNRQVASAELYDPSTGTWSATGSMTVARSGQTATRLKDGEVLVAGGGCNGSGFGCDAGSFEAPLRSAEIYNPATGTWTRTGSMKFGRQFFTATLLRDGDVLAAGGFAECDDDMCSDNRSAELYDPTTGKWSVTGSMRTSRDEQSATLLGNGDVLVTGGFTQEGFGAGHNLSDAELYSPAKGTWRPTASMATARSGQTATLLSNGWVLVASGGTTSAEIYQPQRAIWVSPGAMGTARTNAAATLLPGGHVLVTGGDGPDGQPLASAEEFLAGPGPLVSITPASIAFGGQQVGTTSDFKTYQVTNVGTADLMASGVTVTGQDPGDYRVSTDCTKAAVTPGGTCAVGVRFAPGAPGLRTAAVAVSDNAPLSPQGPVITGYGIGPNAWTPVGPMTTAREEFSATLLPDGKVLMAGGQTIVGNSLASAELYDPATRSFSPTGSLSDARAFPAATLLRSGQVLIAGGLAGDQNLSSAELYNPALGTWRLTTPMHAAGYRLTSTLLPDGSVLVSGFAGTNAAEVYNPAKATWTNTGPMTASQAFATATLLPDGEVLLAGGGTSAAELYNPATNDWTATGALKAAVQGAVAALLPDGTVLVAGGNTVSGGNALVGAELYDPATGTWHTTGSMTVGRYGATATLLPNGHVLVTGGCTGGCFSNQPGLSSAEEYFDGFWVRVASMTQPRVFQTATLLPGGTILVTGGGKNPDRPATATAEFYTPTLMSLHPSSGPVGTQVAVTGSGFYAHETVVVSWNGGQAVLAHAKTSPSGTFATKITIPQSPTGAGTVSAQGSRSFAGASAMFTVTG